MTVLAHKVYPQPPIILPQDTPLRRPIASLFIPILHTTLSQALSGNSAPVIMQSQAQPPSTCLLHLSTSLFITTQWPALLRTTCPQPVSTSRLHAQ